MSKIFIDSLEKKAMDELLFVQKVKNEYKKLTPFEAFKALGEGKVISKIRVGFDNNKELLNVKIIASKMQGIDHVSYYLTSPSGGSMSENLLPELLTEEWFIKL